MRRLTAFLLAVLLLCPPVSASPDTKYVALTFDDGPSGRFTETLLDGLEERGVHATFFLCGYRLEDFGYLAQRIMDAGHEIGLHGYSHDSMAEMSAAQIRRELQDTLDLLPEGCEVGIMRPPGGASASQVRQVCEEMNLSIITWSVDPRDWATDSASEVEQAVLEQTGDGDVILMHDMYDSSVEAALYLIDQLSAQGYQFVTVSQLAKIRRYPLEPGSIYTCFSPV